MRRLRLWLVVLTASCAVQKSFVTSSVDHNSGALHAGVTRLPLNEAVPRTTTLATARGLTLTAKSTAEGGGILLSFTAETEKKWQHQGRFFRIHDSRYWFLLTPRRDGTTVRALGVPVLEGQPSCPPLQSSRFARCTPVELEGRLFEPLHQTVRNTWRLDVSGGMEADTISAILGGLTQAPRDESDF